MARKSRKSKKRSHAQNNVVTPAPLTRRDVLQRLAMVSVAGLAIGGGGTAFALDVRRKLAEQDLSIIGSGLPVVVQIHDPRCSQCAQLQRQARRAMRDFDDQTLAFRIANIRSDNGLAFATEQGAAHVTLLLFDASGNRVGVVQGVTPAQELVARFRRDLGLSPST